MNEIAERPKRQLRQPTKDRLREALAKAADTIAEKNAEIDRLASLLDGEGSVTLLIRDWRERFRLLWAVLRGKSIRFTSRYTVNGGAQ